MNTQRLLGHGRALSINRAAAASVPPDMKHEASVIHNDNYTDNSCIRVCANSVRACTSVEIGLYCTVRCP
jgi:hypothetical protein